MARLTWHGHACYSLVTDDDTRILIDPWLDNNPRADIKAADIAQLNYMLVSHGHSDHFGDGVQIARRTGATVISVFELVAFAQSQGVKNGHGMNVGGGYRFPFGYLKLTPAIHSGQVDGDKDGRYTTVPCGFLLELGARQRLYHAGDTALTMDMQLLKGRVDVALLPIGDNFTMGPEDAVRAVELIEPRVVIPMHYNTFAQIQQDPQEFKTKVGKRAEVVILEPGQSYEF